MNGVHDSEQLPITGLRVVALVLQSCFLCSAMPPHVGWRRPLLLIAFISVGVIGNPEGNALNAFQQSLTDSSNVLQSWDPTALNPCTWFHVTCNAENSVVRLDLQNSGLSGTLVPQLGVLTKLQYLELSGNNISGPIPNELGNLSSLMSLDLFQNNLTGTIPNSLGQLSNLRILRLNNNNLTRSIPVSLTTIIGLQVLDLAYNNLSGEIPNNGSFSLFTPISFLGNNNLCGSLIGKQCPQSPYSPSLPYTSPPYSSPQNGQQSMNLQENQIVQITFLTLILICLLSWDVTMIE